jgi:hypothetical protein
LQSGEELVLAPSFPSVRLSVGPNVSARLQLDGFARNFIFETFMKPSQNANLFKIWHKYQALYINNQVLLLFPSAFNRPQTRHLELKWCQAVHSIAHTPGTELKWCQAVHSIAHTPGTELKWCQVVHSSAFISASPTGRNSV